MREADRRTFLRGATAAAAATAASQVAPARAEAAPPAARTPNLKLSCNLYSFDAPLRRGEMSLEQVIDFCADLGFDAVDPTGYYFPGYPEPPRDGYVHAIALRAFRNGLDVSGTGVRNDFTLPDAAKRAAELERVKRWVEVAATLGAPCLRVFAGNDQTPGPTRDERLDWLVGSLREATAWGERHGVVIACQNHDDYLKTAADVLVLRERAASDWFALNVDIGSLRTADPYDEIARLAPFACTWQLKELVYRNGREERTDVRRVVRIIRDAGYRGYVPIETLGEGDPREKVRRFLGEVRAAMA
jgi:sugar phosphate isomerase/epimerase